MDLPRRIVSVSSCALFVYRAECGPFQEWELCCFRETQSSYSGKGNFVNASDNNFGRLVCWLFTPKVYCYLIYCVNAACVIESRLLLKQLQLFVFYPIVTTNEFVSLCIQFRSLVGLHVTGW